MNRLALPTLVLVLIGSSAASFAQALSGLCLISEAQQTNRPPAAQVVLAGSDCDKKSDTCTDENNSTHNSTIAWDRWTGVSPQLLQGQDAALTARMTAEAGELECAGTVHDGALAGRYHFTPSTTFIQGMASLGFDSITPRKQLGFLMLDVTTAWAKQMQGLGVTDLSTNKLMGLRALHVDAAYIHDMAAAGYPELRANKLTQMKAVGVTPDKVREARSLGFQPTEQELIQMSIFKIDRPFVERMRAKGLTDLTLAKLIKIKIFKLEE